MEEMALNGLVECAAQKPIASWLLPFRQDIHSRTESLLFILHPLPTFFFSTATAAIFSS